MIIGLTGKNAAGKGTIAEHLKQKGFYYYSLSDALREECSNRGMKETRENLISLGNELREKYGPRVLSERILLKMDQDKNYVVDSLRNPEEIKVFLHLPNFTLFYVEAPIETRFKRAQERGRGDAKTLEEFKKIEEKELQSSDANSQQLEECAKLAKIKIDNSGTLEELHKKVDEQLAKLSIAFERPEWDKYFMRIAQEVSTRSNCIKRKVASIIVKDKRIISTGYNGTPRGVKNCNEGGCPRCNSFAKSGTNLSECLCSHGEENAIVQASYHGISLKGTMLYSTLSPCLSCAKMIINAGITKVVFNQDYPLAETASKMLKAAGVELVKYKF